MRRNQLVTQAFAVHNELDKVAPLNGDGHSERLQTLLDEMHSEFGRRRKIQISGLPPDFTEKVMNAETIATFNCSLVHVGRKLEGYFRTTHCQCLLATFLVLVTSVSKISRKMANRFACAVD